MFHFPVQEQIFSVDAKASYWWSKISMLIILGFRVRKKNKTKGHWDVKVKIPKFFSYLVCSVQSINILLGRLTD